MGADPLLAINFVGFPQGELGVDILGQILQGGAEKLAEAGCALAGGHSVDDKELKYGLSVTGIVHPERIITNAGAKPGDALILTKRIGTGVIAQALKAGAIGEVEAAEAVSGMELLNREASLCMRSIATACTDVTGFGLVGHALEMAKASGVCLEISYAKVPKLQRAEELAAAGFLAGGSKRNAAYYQEFADSDLPLNSSERILLCDAQTSGGLLIACPEASCPQLVDEFAAKGLLAAVIGRATEGPAGRLIVTA
jgi:selenide,water dikinase